MSPLEFKGAADPYVVLDAGEVERIKSLMKRYPGPRSAILPALWILQNRQGILSAEGMSEVARALEMPPGPVEAVASFYSMYFFKPHGRYVVEVCTNVSCLLRGSSRVMRRFEQQLGVQHGRTTEDGMATLLEVECLGACGGAPAAQVNHAFFENLTDETVDQLVAAMRSGALKDHALEPGTAAAESQSLVDLRNPGANRVPLPADGAGGNVVDLVKGSGLIPGGEHPAERGYTQARRA